MTNNSIKAAFQRMWEHTVARLNDKADKNHTHDYADSVHNHDDIYYTETEINAKLSEVSESIDNLTYSWDDLTDKPFGEIESEQIIYLNSDPEFIDGIASVSGESFVFGTDLYLATDSDTLPLIYRGFYPYGSGSEGRIIYGNASLVPDVNGENTGENFAFVINSIMEGVVTEGSFDTIYSKGVYSDGVWVVRACRIGAVSETKYLDEKYLPDTIARTDHNHDDLYSALDHVHSWNDLEDKPFGEEIADNVLSEGIYSNGDELPYDFAIPISFSDQYIVIDGYKAPYMRTGRMEYAGYWFAGDSYLAEINGADDNYITLDSGSYSFAVLESGSGLMIYFYDSEPHTVQLVRSFNTIIPLDEKFIPSTIARVDDIPEGFSGSWNDLEDRPFGEIERKTVICESYGEINPGPFLIDKWNPADLSLIEEGESYIVEIDGVEHGPSVARFVEEMQAGQMVLALNLFNPDNYSFEEFPVSISDYAGGLYIYFEDGGTHNAKLKRLEKTLKPLDEKYIPDTIARADHNHDDVYSALGHVHSYNDLEDKIVGEESTFAELYSNTFTYVANFPKYDALLPACYEVGEIDGLDIEAFKEYSVVFDGIKYNVMSGSVWNEGVTYIFIGNGALFNALQSNTGEPFVFIYNPNQGKYYIVCENSAEVEHQIRIGEETVTIKQLDETFIPDTIARQSALESYETKSDATAKLTEAKAYADEVGSGLQTQLNTIVNNPDTEGIINSINEFTQYITEHGEIAEGFRTDIDSKASKEEFDAVIGDMSAFSKEVENEDGDYVEVQPTVAEVLDEQRERISFLKYFVGLGEDGSESEILEEYATLLEYINAQDLAIDSKIGEIVDPETYEEISVSEYLNNYREKIDNKIGEVESPNGEAISVAEYISLYIGEIIDPETDEPISIVDALSQKVDQSEFNDHIYDEIAHITEDEREAWNVAEENAKAYTDEQIGSHAHSWNDLTDKPFGLTGELVVIADGITSEPSYDMNADTYTSDIAINEDFVWEDGMVFNILYYDTKYTATVKPDGRQKKISFYDEDPWTGIDIYSDGSIVWTSYDLGAFPITITYGEQQVETIDEIYIPEAIARVSDISTNYAEKNHTHIWDDLDGKPFYEERDCIWSGTYADMELLETRTIDGYECVKVSNLDTAGDLNQAEYVIYETNPDSGHVFKRTETLNLDDFNFEPNYVKCSWDGIYVVSNSFEDNAVTIPFGLWIRKDEWRYVGEIYRLIIEQLNEKFIPNTIARAADIPTDYAKEDHKHSWDDLEDTPFSEVMEITTLLPERVFNIAPYDSAHASFPCMLVLGETYTVTVDGSVYEIECTYNDEYGGRYELHVNDDFYIYQETHDTGINLDNSSESLMTVSVSVVGLGKAGVVLDEQYIPDTIARVSDIPEGFSGSWYDLTDKPFGETKIVYPYNQSGYVTEWFNDNMQVVYDGQTYELTPKTWYGSMYGSDYKIQYYGDGGLYAGEASLESDMEIPFLISIEQNLLTYSEPYFSIKHVVDNVEHTIEIYEVKFNQLDEQFIPDTIARKTDVEPALSLATEAIILNTETISLHTEQIAALQTEVATIVEITKEEVDALFALTE